MLTNKSKLGVLVIGLVLLFSCSVYASDLNGVGTQNPTIQQQEKVNQTPKDFKLPPLDATSSEKKQQTEDTAKAIGDMFSRAGVDAESLESANAFVAPFAAILNKVMAGILGVTSLLMMFITVLDLLYMAFPPVRDMLDGGMNGPQQMQGGRNGNGGMHGMRGSMGLGQGIGGVGIQGGMEMGVGLHQRQQNPTTHGGGLSAVGRWVSDEAIAACIETQGGPIGASNLNGTVQIMIISYMKKRTLFLILFGICVVLFTSTVFTDLGFKIGTWVLKMIMGFGS